MTAAGRAPTVCASAILLAAGLLGTLSGCEGHGQHTQAHLDEATEKLSLVKSGVEWQLAHQRFMAGDLDKALKSINTSIALNDKVPKAHVLRGRILLEKGDLEEARASLLKAEEVDPKFDEAQYYLGIVHERLNEHEEALSRYQKAADLVPDNAQYAVAASEMLVHLGRPDEAQAYLEARSATFAHSAAVRQSLAHLATLRGDRTKAAELLREAHLLAPDDQLILEDLARAQIACGEYGDAEFHLVTLLKSMKDEPRRDLQFLRARCLVVLDRPVEARELLLGLTTTPEGARDVEAWIELAKVARLLNDPMRLRGATARIIALAPERPEGYLFRSLQLLEAGDDEGALAAADRAATLAPDDPAPLVQRAVILERLGRIEDARMALLVALERDPSHSAAGALLSSIESAQASVAEDAPQP